MQNDNFLSKKDLFQIILLQIFMYKLTFIGFYSRIMAI